MARYTANEKFERGTSFGLAFKDIVNDNWDFSKNTLKPSEISCGNSRKKVWLLCEKYHSFQMTPYNIKLGQWCPTCKQENSSEIMRNALFKKERSFGFLYPKYIQYWSEKNKLTPYEVMSGSDYSFLFHCDRGHEFPVRISNIVYNNRWCPYCSNKKVNDENSFASYNTNLVKNWSSRNEKSPHEVSYGSDYEAWFTCDLGHEWKARCADINRGKWCMQCSNRPTISNEIVDKLLVERNKTFIRIENYVNARKPLLFFCKDCKKEFKCSYDSIARLNVGCSNCKQSKGELEIANLLDTLQIPYVRQKTFENLVGLKHGLLKFDFFLENKGKVLLIEYDGLFHFQKLYDDDGHEAVVAHDKIKNKYCEENNIPLLRIPYWDFDNIATIVKGKLCELDIL